MTPDPEARIRFAERLVRTLSCAHTVGFFLAGSTVTNTATPYSDIDLAHVVTEGYDGPVKKSYYNGDLLAVVNARTVERWYAALTQPELAIFVVPAMRSARILLDPQGVIARYRSDLANFTWEPLQDSADRFAGAMLASQAETVHKVLSGLVRGEGIYDPAAMLVLDLTRAIAVQRGVMVESSASYMPQVRSAVGDDSAWSRWHRVATAQSLSGHPPPSLREQAVAAMRLYLCTFDLLESRMLPDRRALAASTAAVVGAALRQIA